MPQFQYERINRGDFPRQSDEIDLLDGLGREGWELVVVMPNNVAYLKRQLRPARSDPAAMRSKSPGSLG
jgi:hypothetical protein